MKRSYHPKQTLLAAGIALALGSGAAHAGGINFDPTGNGLTPGQIVDEISWTGGATLGYDLFPPAFQTIQTPFGEVVIPGAPRAGYLFGQGVMSEIKNGGQNLGLQGLIPDAGGVFTYEFSIGVTSQLATLPNSTIANPNIINFDNNGDTSDTNDAFWGDLNFFNIYYDPTSDIDVTTTTAGTGYGAESGGDVGGDRKLILSSKININTQGARYEINDPTLVELNEDGGTDNATVQGGGSVSLDVQVCTGDDVIAGIPGCNAASTIDTDYFPFPMDSFTLDFLLTGDPDADFVGDLTTPFLSNNPEHLEVLGIDPFLGDQEATGLGGGGFDDGTRAVNDFNCHDDGTSPAPAVPTLLGVDGVAAPIAARTGCDMLFAARSATSSFNGTPVPEPTTLGLMGIALTGFAFGRKRLAKKA